MKGSAIWIRNSKNVEVDLSLDDQELKIFATNSRRSHNNAEIESTNSCSNFPLNSIRLTDVVGCQRMKGRSPADTTSYFCVYSYPLDIVCKSKAKRELPEYSRQKSTQTPAVTPTSNADGRIDIDAKSDTNGLRNHGRRRRQCLTFQFGGKNVYEQNVTVVNAWIDAIRAGIIDRRPPHLVTSAQALSRQRRLYVLINPHSGPGRALQIFQDRVMPVFAEANVICRVVITERANHAQDIVRNLDLNAWDGIVIVSGDGLVYEVINGLTKHPDRENAFRIPIGAIPGGSGNALASTACFAPYEAVKGDFSVDAAIVVVRPEYKKMRLVRVETRHQQALSFISVGWGILSDIDIESERFRRTLGTARFTAGAVMRVLNLRRYRGRISYLPTDGVRKSLERLPQVGSPLNGRRNSSGGSDAMRAAHVQRTTSVSVNFLDVNDEHVRLINSPSAAKAASSFQVQFDLSKNSTESNSSATVSVNDEKYFDIVQMPDINDPVPDDWLVIEDELILFYAVYMNHIGSEVPYMPYSRLDDQCIYLTLIRASEITRPQLIKFLFAMEHTEHLAMPFFEIIPVKAFRLDRLSGNGDDVVVVDGELISCGDGPIQACVSELSATIMTIKT